MMEVVVLLEGAATQIEGQGDGPAEPVALSPLLTGGPYQALFSLSLSLQGAATSGALWSD